jgi:hypothetical protein
MWLLHIILLLLNSVAETPTIGDVRFDFIEDWTASGWSSNILW